MKKPAKAVIVVYNEFTVINLQEKTEDIVKFHNTGTLDWFIQLRVGIQAPSIKI